MNETSALDRVNIRRLLNYLQIAISNLLCDDQPPPPALIEAQVIAHLESLKQVGAIYSFARIPGGESLQYPVHVVIQPTVSLQSIRLEINDTTVPDYLRITRDIMAIF